MTDTLKGKLERISKYNAEYQSRGLKIGDTWVNLHATEEECKAAFSDLKIGKYTEIDVDGNNIVFIHPSSKKSSETSEKVSEISPKNLEQLSSIYKNCLVLAKELLTPYKEDKYNGIPIEEVRIVATTLFIAYNKLNE